MRSQHSSVVLVSKINICVHLFCGPRPKQKNTRSPEHIATWQNVPPKPPTTTSHLQTCHRLTVSPPGCWLFELFYTRVGSTLCTPGEHECTAEHWNICGICGSSFPTRSGSMDMVSICSDMFQSIATFRCRCRAWVSVCWGALPEPGGEMPCTSQLGMGTWKNHRQSDGKGHLSGPTSLTLLKYLNILNTTLACFYNSSVDPWPNRSVVLETHGLHAEHVKHQLLSLVHALPAPASSDRNGLEWKGAKDVFANSGLLMEDGVLIEVETSSKWLLTGCFTLICNQPTCPVVIFNVRQLYYNRDVVLTWQIANLTGLLEITVQGPRTPWPPPRLTWQIMSAVAFHGISNSWISQETVRISWRRVDVAMLKNTAHTHTHKHTCNIFQPFTPRLFSSTQVQDSQRTAREACEAPDSGLSMHEMPMVIVNPIRILYHCWWSWNPCIIEVRPFRCVACNKCILHWGSVPFGRCPRVILQGIDIWAQKIWVAFSCIASHMTRWSSMEA